MQQKEKNNNQINLTDLFMYLLGHWYLFILSIVLCVGFAWYRYAKTPHVYRSDATVIIKDPSNSQSTVHMDNYSGLINRITMSNEILQLKSRELMTEVVRTLDADISYIRMDKLREVEMYNRTPVRMLVDRNQTESPWMRLEVTVKDATSIVVNRAGQQPLTVALGDTLLLDGNRICFQPTPYYNASIGKTININRKPATSAAAGYLSRLKIQQTESDGTILSISIQDYSLPRAIDILNTLIEKYNEDAIREKNRIAVNTAAFINERLLIIQDELNEVEDDIAAFKISERIMSVDEAAAGYLSQSKEYSSSIVELETREKLADYLEDYLKSSFKTFETIPVNIGLDESNINQAIDQYNQLILQRERLLEASSPDSPAVRQTETALLPLRQNILGYIATLKSSIGVQKSELAKRERESLRQFTTLPAKARHLLSFERQQKIKESLYIFLLNKREENALTQAMVDNNARMIDSAEGSGNPIYPDRNKMLLVAFLIGLFVPALILVVMVATDNKIRSRSDIINAGDLPFLADIPATSISKKTRKKNPDKLLIEYNNTTRVFKEAMRMMCTNIDFTKPEGCPTPVLMTTSFNSGAGKSFISRNIAACLADAAKKVVIVDTDLRKRSISNWFGMKHRTAGLSNLLVDKDLDFEAVLQKDVLEGVDFIPAGHVPPNPIELLSRSRMEDLVNYLKTRYDYIILDGTPVNMVADTMVVTRVVDINLFVLRCGTSDRRQLPMVKELCDDGRMKNMSIVLNGTEIRRTYGYSYGYGYGYGYYGYGYGYGYGGGYDTPDPETADE